MEYFNAISSIDGIGAVSAVNETLKRIDPRLVDHGSRVAFIACELNEAGNLGFDTKKLLLLCFFHDIGAYKTDEIDKLVEFETSDVKRHSIYGYLFIKHLTPLKESAEAILYHHTNADDFKSIDSAYKGYAALIHIADRIDIAMNYSNEKMLEDIAENSNNTFVGEYVDIYNKYFKKNRIAERINDGSYHRVNLSRLQKVGVTTEEAIDFLKMIVFSIDFRSENTVTHTINTVAISLNIAKHFGLNESEMECLYLGALLHDVGKIAIPY